jgi:uncharacterized protein
MTSAPSRVRAPRPVPSGVEYHRVLAGEKRRIGRGILAIVLLVGGMFAAIVALSAVGTWIDGLLGTDAGVGSSAVTPVAFAAGLAATALLTPWSMLLQRWLYGVPAPSLHSVVSRFRFDVFGRSLLAILPLFLIVLAITEWLDPRSTAVWEQGDLIFLFVLVVVLVPLQSAGEEYGLRGLVFRIAGGWARSRWLSLALGLVVPTVVFALIHTAGDPWWNVFYIVFGLTTGFVTWRSGGVEIAVVVHAVYNVMTFTFWFVLQGDLTERFDRSPGAVTPALLIPSALAFIAIAVVVWLRTRRSGPATTP